MSDFLNYVERNYGCVAEYQRCQMEDEEYAWEKQMEINEKCAKNKAKLNEVGKRAMYFSDNCIGCKHYESVGPMSYSIGWGDTDDVEHGICHHREIPPIDGHGCKNYKEVVKDGMDSM